MPTKIAVVIPTLNGGSVFQDLVKSLLNQSIDVVQTLVLDSDSTDGTVEVAVTSGFAVIPIKRQNFNHGTTRQLAVNILADCGIIVFLTQDAILSSTTALAKLVAAFTDPLIGCAYGRQLPHVQSNVIGAHARVFNYSAHSKVKTLADASELGIKTAFISNSFAAYRREALMSIGGFPKHTILGEDTYVAAKMLLAGWEVAYCAEAQVYHSHDYNFLQVFKRYFDTGVFHCHEVWIREKFGGAEGEGLRFVLSEAKYLLVNGKGYLLPSAFIRNCLKYLGYRLGMKEQVIPTSVKKKLSMNSRYWD